MSPAGLDSVACGAGDAFDPPELDDDPADAREVGAWEDPPLLQPGTAASPTASPTTLAVTVDCRSFTELSFRRAEPMRPTLGTGRITLGPTAVNAAQKIPVTHIRFGGPAH